MKNFGKRSNLRGAVSLGGLALHPHQRGAASFYGDDMKPAGYGPVYAAGIYPPLAEIFRKHGYALAIHGSVGRDFDLVAAPWVDAAAEPRTVMDEVWKSFAMYAMESEPQSRPHGRLTYLCHLSFAECYLDISFMPRAAAVALLSPTKCEKCDDCRDADATWDCRTCGGGYCSSCRGCGH